MTERQIGNYKILKQIGAGGMAKVYLAVHKDVPNLKVVLKILSSPQHAARFMQEADKLALLERNPNICHIRHFFTHEDELVIAMEYIDGKSLEELIAEKGKFSVEETVGITTDLLTALAFAHEKGIFHRDIKPGNVMFDRDGLLKIIDFGIAKGKTDPQMTIVGTATGTPEYMAPEQFAGGENLDYAKCDIYAVGTMMYAMLTGRPPFTGENEFLLRDAKLSENPAPPSSRNKEIPGGLDRIILKAIDKDPARRFSSVAEMKAELLKFAGAPERPAKSPAPNAPATSPAPSRPRRGSRGRIVGAAAAVVIVAAVAIFGLRMMSGGEDRRGGSGTVRMPANEGGATGTGAPADTQAVVEPAAPEPRAAKEEPAEEKAATGAAPGGTAGEKKPEAAATGAAAEPGAGAPTGARPSKPPQPATGSLIVSSRPKNASIYINGELQYEKTPYTFERPPGRYTVRIVQVVGGREIEYSKTVTLGSGETEIVSHTFEE
jgi:predicted Ser/Thr protein kinase